MEKPKKIPKEELKVMLDDLLMRFGDYICKHIESGGLYRIMNFGLNVHTGAIEVSYFDLEMPSLVFHRDWTEFQDGRFELGTK